jgi:hypothetical protein
MDCKLDALVNIERPTLAHVILTLAVKVPSVLSMPRSTCLLAMFARLLSPTRKGIHTGLQALPQKCDSIGFHALNQYT